MPQISPSSQAASATTPQAGKLPNLRWIICGLLLFASTINYVDRQTIAVLKPTLQHSLHWSESDYGWIVFSFQFAYAVMMLLAGRIIDAIGTRLGFAITMVWWSLAAMGHALATGAISFGVARFLLGMGEAGNFPASIKTVAEWFPRRERALATGIFNAGTNIGAVLAPPLVVWLTLRWSWHEAFIFTGSLGLLWLIFWLALYYPPLQHKRLSSEELAIIESDRDLTIGAPAIPWRQLASCRQAWGVIVAKFCTDPVWWFFIFWLPSYLIQGRGMTLKQIGYFAWIPFLAEDIGSVRVLHAGGYCRGFCPQSLDGHRSDFRLYLGTPGLVGQRLHAGFRPVPAPRRGYGYRHGRGRRRRRRHDYRARRRLYAAMVPYLRAAFHCWGRYAPTGAGSGTLDYSGY